MAFNQPNIIKASAGGTGINNGVNTLTLGGTLTTSGAFNSTFTMTGATAVTFPTSGTLATTTQLPTPAALTRTNDTNVTLTLGGTPNTALLQATSVTLGWTGTLATGRGGLGGSTTPTTGTLLTGNGTAWIATTATYPSTATGTGTILRANGTNWAATTATYPTTTTINQLIYSSANNTISEITAAANSVLITSGTNVPSLSTTLPSAVQNNITAVNSAANTLSIGGGVKTFVTGAVNVAASANTTTWTPGIAFGGAAVGITYAFNIGRCSITTMPNGTIKTECWASIGLSSKGSSTGTATITGFPTPTGANANVYIFAASQEMVTSGVGAQLFCDMTASANPAVATIRSYATASANTTMTNVTFANTSVVKFYAVYWND